MTAIYTKGRSKNYFQYFNISSNIASTCTLAIGNGRRFTRWAIVTSVTLKWLQRSQPKVMTPFSNFGHGIHFCYRHLQSTGNGLAAMNDFHFRDLEMTPSRSSKVKFFCGFWKSDIDFQIVFHSNHMLISHHQEDIGDFHIRDLEMTPKGQSR